ncbi:MAG: M28 family peptidase [Dehalococcoidia bacterium]
MKAFVLLGIVIMLLVMPLSMACSGPGQSSYAVSADSIRAKHQALFDISAKEGGLDAGIRLNEAGDRAAEYILAGYKEAGLQNVRFEEFKPLRWWPENYELSVLANSATPGKKLVAFPLWYCEGVDNAELEVAYVGYGTPGEWQDIDVKGKAVLMDMKRILHFIPSFQMSLGKAWAKDSGAAALILADTLIDSPSGISAGNAGKLKNQQGDKAELYPIPAFSIGKSDGDYLRNALKSGPTKVKMNLKYSLAPGHAVNIVGELPGNGKTDEYVIVGGHYDSWFAGAIDNLGSQASMLETAKYFSQMPQAGRNRNIIFVSLFGHEFGGEVENPNAAMGHAAFVEKRADISNKITCFLDIDGAGSWGYEEKGNTGQIYATNMDDKGGIFATSWALTEIAAEPTYIYGKGPWGQYPINSMVADLAGPISNAGWPCLLLISKHIYYHSLLDTMEKITPDQVYRRTLMNIDVIKKLLDSPAGYLQAIDGNPKAAREVKNIPDVSIEVIPAKIKAGSLILVWPGLWNGNMVIRPDGIVYDFGDNTPTEAKVAAGHVYQKPGTYTVTMTVTDIAGRYGTAKQTVEVTE